MSKLKDRNTEAAEDEKFSTINPMHEGEEKKTPIIKNPSKKLLLARSIAKWLSRGIKATLFIGSTSLLGYGALGIVAFTLNSLNYLAVIPKLKKKFLDTKIMKTFSRVLEKAKLGRAIKNVGRALSSPKLWQPLKKIGQFLTSPLIKRIMVITVGATVVALTGGAAAIAGLTISGAMIAYNIGKEILKSRRTRRLKQANDKLIELHKSSKQLDNLKANIIKHLKLSSATFLELNNHDITKQRPCVTELKKTKKNRLSLIETISDVTLAGIAEVAGILSGSISSEDLIQQGMMVAAGTLGNAAKAKDEVKTVDFNNRLKESIEYNQIGLPIYKNLSELKELHKEQMLNIKALETLLVKKEIPENATLHSTLNEIKNDLRKTPEFREKNKLQNGWQNIKNIFNDIVHSQNPFKKPITMEEVKKEAPTFKPITSIINNVNKTSNNAVKKLIPEKLKSEAAELKHSLEFYKSSKSREIFKRRNHNSSRTL